uniref:PHD-type zinc finger plants domain-containing protein n=1 Tax=Leersia perrieri TaxID=77586 RepID=A0A0D9W5M7_9ORYZ
MASSPSTSVGGGVVATAAGDVCCMCGDIGLPEELFRCRLCRVRHQHRYCSDLYPRATAYKRCNWCLREPVPGGAHANAAAEKATVRRKATADETSTSSGEAERQQRLQEAAGCAAASRRAPETGLGRPVKKQKIATGADEGEAAGARAAAKGNNGNKKAKEAGRKRTGVKVRVRRYRLLAEVISC